MENLEALEPLRSSTRSSGTFMALGGADLRLDGTASAPERPTESRPRAVQVHLEEHLLIGFQLLRHGGGMFRKLRQRGDGGATHTCALLDVPKALTKGLHHWQSYDCCGSRPLLYEQCSPPKCFKIQ